MTTCIQTSRPETLHVMWKTVSEDCNLACDYCYYSTAGTSSSSDPSDGYGSSGAVYRSVHEKIIWYSDFLLAGRGAAISRTSIF